MRRKNSLTPYQPLWEYTDKPSVSTENKLDEILRLSRETHNKVDKIIAQVNEMDKRLSHLEASMSHVTIKALAAGGVGGAVITVGIELLKAKFGGL